MASTRVMHCCFYCIVLLWIQHAPNNSPAVIMTSWRLGGDIHISSFIVLEVHHHTLRPQNMSIKFALPRRFAPNYRTPKLVRYAMFAWIWAKIGTRHLDRSLGAVHG
ncbi:hypothetical protein HBI47_044010 [Parastagonospora nodorum]|nr:hypothetical protein HBI47_044010 [Parastagonospora nodorum]